MEIERNVKFFGFKSAEEIAKLHLENQVYVLPTENDNAPNSISEAMVSGMPIIATSVGGIPSMIKDGETGILIKPNAPEELAEKIIYLFNNPYERERLGNNAKKTARKRYSLNNVINETLVAYNYIISS